MNNTKEDRERLLNYFKEHTSDDWFEKYYGALMGPIFVQAFFAVVRANQNSGYAMDHGMFFQNFTKDREFDWMWNISEMKDLREVFFNALEKDQSSSNKFFKKYLYAWKYFDKAVKKEEKINYKKLSNEDLADRLLNLIEISGKQGTGYAVDCFLSISGDDWFVEYLEKYLGRKTTEEEADILREPTKRSFVNEAQLLVLEAACKKQEGKNIDKYLEKLVKEFYWVENNYLKTNPKTKVQFLEDIDEVDGACDKYEEEKNRIKNNLENKNKIYKKIKASKLLKAFIQMADDFTFIQDCRKQVVLRLNHFIFLYYKELAKRLKFDEELIFYITPFEISDFIKNPEKFLEISKTRQKGCLAIYDKDGYAIFSKEELKDVDLSNFFKDYSGINQAQGTTASPGNVKGLARVIIGSDQFENFKEGEVLITNQTTPDFVPLMKKASAIVAEQGGVTSHAAIVSRELGIPCIVGVKDAMRIFKDGEEVELDTNKGVIKKI